MDKKTIAKPKNNVSFIPTDDLIAAVIEYGELRGIRMFTHALQAMAAEGYTAATGKTIAEPMRHKGGFRPPKGFKLVPEDET